MTWDGLRESLRALKNTSIIFPPLSSATESLLSCLDGLEVVSRKREDFEDLAGELTTLSNSLNQYMVGSSTRMSDSVASAAISIESQAKGVRGVLDRAAIGDIREPSADEELGRHYRRIEAHFRQLQVIVSMSTWSIEDEHRANPRLEGLNSAKQATYDSSLSTGINRRGCAEGTRIGILAGLYDWLYNFEASPVYWMNGMAGTGKTTIASTFCEQVEERKLLAASFFCTRSSAECRIATRIVPTIAYQLARYSIPYQSALCKILEQSPDTGSTNVSRQFELLLKEPLQQVKDAIPEHLVVVIDALDECDDRDGVELIIDMLFRYAPQVPLKFLITSRPEPEIYDKMIHSKSREVIHLHEIEKSLVQADIELYLNEELAFIPPSPAEIKQLVDHSGTLFIYAATLVRYIRSGKADPQKRLQSILSVTPQATKQNTHIDALYMAVLKSALREYGMGGETEDIWAVLRTVLSAQEPISIETIAALAGIDGQKRVEYALDSLRSVLYQSEGTRLVSTLHASFPDFMFSNERSGSYYCDIIEYSQLMAQRCFLVMKEQLRFNICDLATSFVPDEKLQGLQEQIKAKISSTLAYTCRYWASHLALAPKSGTVLKALDEFLSHRLLFWMEVLSLRREIAMGVDMMLKVQKWLTFIYVGSVSPELTRLVGDACTFVIGFAVNPVSRSTPHIYISSLAFCPKSSSVYKHYSNRTQGMLDLKGSLVERMEAAALATWNIGSAIWSVAYSPDGIRVAIGCRDETVRILNAFDGMPLVEPLRGHTGLVWTVAFSPEGKFLVSGSTDRTIRIWNAHNGVLTAGPFVGHTGSVNSVSFSPDGTRLVSGGDDGIIRIWGVYDGTVLLVPSEHPSDRVKTVAFSPNGAFIASGSDGKTVRLWDAHNGTAAAAPFEGHTASITCLAFTPDGTRLISGSDDKTVCIWDVSNGSLVTSPLEGHTSRVASVAVSPDGTRVATGSKDRTVRVWKIEDGTRIAGPFVDDHGEPFSIQVAYSPDGTRVISGSENGTVNVWNVYDGTLLPPPSPYQNAISSIKSVVFCPDNIHFLSSSARGVVRIWDTTDGSFITISDKSEIFPTPLSMLSPDGSYVASTCDNGEVQITSTTNGSIVAGPFGTKRTSLSAFWFSHNSKAVVMGTHTGIIKVCDIKSPNIASGSFKSDNWGLYSLAETRDSSLLVSYSGRSGEENLRVWNIVAPVLDLGQDADPSLESNLGSTYDYAALNDGWSITKDGWMVNNRQQLLFWIPAKLASVWYSPYAILVITNAGTLQVPKQKPLIGAQWASCYTPI
ncbi:unnamed protein product [Rhizoctonia solani]|uniref:Nephrocystin 3-like N-terminal domain-containing protein n=1 Tax=Rhizoctonia solani TaxID=456999 RepID=A0A8H3DQP6_9AGAM|nr:unnamed protein product [Rhizoctonia solani]